MSNEKSATLDFNKVRIIYPPALVLGFDKLSARAQTNCKKRTAKFKWFYQDIIAVFGLVIKLAGHFLALLFIVFLIKVYSL